MNAIITNAGLNLAIHLLIVNIEIAAVSSVGINILMIVVILFIAGHVLISDTHIIIPNKPHNHIQRNTIANTINRRHHHHLYP